MFDADLVSRHNTAREYCAGLGQAFVKAFERHRFGCPQSSLGNVAASVQEELRVPTVSDLADVDQTQMDMVLRLRKAEPHMIVPVEVRAPKLIKRGHRVDRLGFEEQLLKVLLADFHRPSA
jgi:hypothetical protein